MHATDLVDNLRLLHLELVQTLNRILDDLPSLLQPTRESREWFVKLALHLPCNCRVCLCNRLGFPTDHIQRRSKGSALA